jgi:hypothetical protein
VYVCAGRSGSGVHLGCWTDGGNRKAILKAQAARCASGRGLGVEASGRGVRVDLVSLGLQTAALPRVLTHRVVKQRLPRPPKCDAPVVAAPEKCWAMTDVHAGQRWRCLRYWSRCCAAIRAGHALSAQPRRCTPADPGWADEPLTLATPWASPPDLQSPPSIRRPFDPRRATGFCGSGACRRQSVVVGFDQLSSGLTKPRRTAAMIALARLCAPSFS